MLKAKRKSKRSTPYTSTIDAPKHRTQIERRETTRRIILDAAVDAMSQQGATGLRMEDVERNANLSRGALLHHFRTKEELLLATFEFINERSLERSRERTKFAGRARSIADVIDAIVKDATEFFFGRGFFVELALGFRQSQPSLRTAVIRMSRQSRFAVESSWRATLRSHGLPEDVAGDVLDLTLNIVRGFVLRRFMDDNPTHRAHLIGVWQDMIRCYLKERLDARGAEQQNSDAELPGIEQQRLIAEVVKIKKATPASQRKSKILTKLRPRKA
jgi:AcrR family transcriptional regulator